MKPTIVMIHGMFGGGWCWENFQPYFEKAGYPCVAPTLRHHDVDPAAPPPAALATTSVRDYADDLVRDIRALDGPYILMGHSMGGLLAQMLAARTDPAACVLIAPAAPGDILVLTPSVVRSFFDTITTWAFWQKPVSMSFENAVYAFFHRLPREEQERIYARLVCESGRAVFEIGLALLDLGKATRVDASRVTCPVLVLAGAEDRVTPASVMRKVADKYARVSTFRQFAGHAHMLIAEPGWQDIAATIQDWIEKRI